MARKRKGRDVNGWLVVDKPAGMTSTSVVNKVKWALQAKKAGHAGTLDPEATGVLAVALGEATKTVPYITDALKAYEFTVRLGQATNTDDAEGEVIASSDARPTDDEIKAALGAFVGDIMQVPPQYSAVKIDGQRAYKLAREGETFEVAARPLWVEELLLVDRPDADHAFWRWSAARAGTSARSRGIWARRWGVTGMSWRCGGSGRGPFEAENGLNIEQIEAMAQSPRSRHVSATLGRGAERPAMVTATPEGAARLRNGNPGMVIANDVEYGEECWAAQDGRAVAVGVSRQANCTRAACSTNDRQRPRSSARSGWQGATAPA